MISSRRLCCSAAICAMMLAAESVVQLVLGVVEDWWSDSRGGALGGSLVPGIVVGLVGLVLFSSCSRMNRGTPMNCCQSDSYLFCWRLASSQMLVKFVSDELFSFACTMVGGAVHPGRGPSNSFKISCNLS